MVIAKENKFIKSKKIHSWNFQKGLDTESSFNAFIIYRDMGVKRSIRAVAKQLQCTDEQISRWCTKCNWIDRIADFNAWKDQEKIEADLKNDIKNHVNKLNVYRREHERLGWANLTIAQSCLEIAQKAIEYINEDPERIRTMRTGDIRNLVAAARDSGDIGSKLLSDSLAVAKLLESMPIDVEAIAVDTEVTLLSDE
ncbi:MAG: hypothetical protein V7L23_13240 [Nostoc sp.]|uniref:hypothetical protein n=1 Tax=Nostoc sp. TaxID=1180 RepID=UPI002FF06E34